MMTTDESKSHYVYIKDFSRFMCNTTKNKNKKHFCKYCLQCFSSAKVLQEHERVLFKINGKQSEKLKKGLTKFKNHFKQLAAPFKIYVNFESIWNGLKEIIAKIILHIKKNIKIIFLAVFYTKLYVLMIDLANQLFFTEEKMQSKNLLKQF